MNRFKIVIFSALFLVLPCCFGSAVYAQSEAARKLNLDGLNAINSGRHQEAIQLLKKAMQLEPGWGEPYYNAAKLLRLTKKREAMKGALKKAHSLEPSNATYAEGLARVLKEDLANLIKSGNVEAAKKLRQEILKVNPAEIGIGVEIFNQLVSENQITKAADLAETLIEKNPKLRTRYDSEPMGQLYFNLAKLELDRNQLTQAKYYADNASKYSFGGPGQAKRLISEIKKKQTSAIEALLLKAKEQQASGNIDAAISTLKRAKEIDSYNEEAENELSKILGSRDSKDAFAEAEEMVRKESWLEARDMLEYVISNDPDNSKARKLLKEATVKEEALMKKLGRATKLPRSSDERASLVEGYLRKGVQFADANNYQDAEVSFSRGISLIELDSSLKHYMPQFQKEMGKISKIDNRKDLWQRGVEARNTYEYEECIKLLSQLPKRYNSQLPSYLAEAYWKTGNKKEALSNARYQLTIEEENSRAKFILGSILLEEGDKDQAFKYFKEVYDFDSSYPGINDKLLESGTSKWKTYFPAVVLVLLLWIAYALYKYLPEYNKNTSIKRAQKYLKKEMLDECIEELTKIRRLPILTAYDGAFISRILAQAYLKKGGYDRAIGECKHLLSISQQDEEAHTWLGYAYLGRRMVSPESLPELLKLYQKDGRNIALVSLLGSHYTQQKVLSEEGVKILEQWLNLDPNNLDVLKPLGRYYLKKSRSDDKATKVFQKMMEFGSPEPEFLLGVAKINLKLRQFDECLRLCEQVINEDVNNELVHAVLLEAYNKQHRTEDLLAIYKNFLQNNPYNVAFQNGLKQAQMVADSIAAKKAQQPEDTADSPAEEPLAQIICQHCQKPNGSDEYYCQHCGQSLA